MNLTDHLRKLFGGLLNTIGKRLNQLGITPNTVTLTGLACNILAAYFIAEGKLLTGGIIVLFTGPLDAIDGAMARSRGAIHPFGAFLDSVVDRYSELAIFLGLLILNFEKADTTAILLTFLAASGSFLVSYTRARAESLGYDCKAGIMTRVERFLIMVISLISNQVVIGLWIIAIGANLTAIQRILIVKKQMENQISERGKQNA